MDSRERFDETSLPDKKAFYSELYLEDITDEDYTHVQRVFEELKLKNFGDFHDLYVQSNTLSLGDIFENFKNKCIEIYELSPAYFLSAPGLGGDYMILVSQDEILSCFARIPAVL